jgi:hypothetical protein
LSDDLDFIGATVEERPFMAVSFKAEISVERRFSAAFSNQLGQASFSSQREVGGQPKEAA